MAKRPKLTKRLIDTLRTDKPGGERTYCGAEAGFGIHTLPSGRASFFLEYSAPGGGSRRRMRLGAYGTELTLAQARDEARRLRGLVRRGVDPLEERKLEREAGTFAEWAERFKELGAAAGRWAPRTRVEVDRHLRRACEAFGRKRLADVDAPTVERFRDRIHERHGLTEANKSLGTIKTALGDAWRRGLVPTNEAAKVRAIGGKVPRSRTLNEAEMAALLQAVESHPDRHFRASVLWLALTGARRSEILRARWGDLQLDPPDRAQWTIPKAKNKRPSVRPLPAPLVPVVDSLPREDLLVVGHRWTATTFHNRWVKLRAAAGLPDDIHLHDLRRTAGLWIARTAGLQAAQRLLGHANIGTTAAVYSPLSVDDLREHQNAAVAKILPFRKAEGEGDDK